MTAPAPPAQADRRAGTPGPLVIKLGGLAVEHPDQAEPLLRAIADLHRAGPPRVVLVHGGGGAVDDHLARLGMETRRHEGLRVTTPEQIPEVVGVLAGRVNKSIVGAVQNQGVAAVGLCLGDGLITRAEPIRRAGADLGLVGEIVGGDPALLRLLLAEGYMPVISPIAMDSSGHPLNVNADDAAAAVAALIGARLLVLLTDVPGILGEDGALVASADAGEIDRLIASGVIRGGMIPKARAALRAAAVAGIRTVIASWNQPERLAALAGGAPIGTCIHPPANQPAAAGQPELPR